MPPPPEIIEGEKTAYLEAFPASNPDWPPDVRAVYRDLRNHLFDMGLEAQSVVENCGIGSHDIYSRFRHFTGRGIKEFIIYHRLELAKRLLRRESLLVSQVAFAVGYASSSGFSATFSRWHGCSPSTFQKTSA